MRPDLSVKLGLLAVVLAAAALATSSLRPGGESPSGLTSHAPEQQSEIVRIREHLAGAEELLLNADVSSLSPVQRAARARNVELLRGYRERGVFPRNLDFRTRQPYFVDDRGVLCAMAYLVAKSGRNDIVERVRTTRNNARIQDLADDPMLIAWLDEAGLTVGEAARIQPSYDDGGVGIIVPDEVSRDHAVASVGAGLVNVVAIALNIPRRGASLPSRWTGVFGVVAGATGLVLGAPRIADGGAATALGAWNVAAGTLAAVAGGHTLYAHSRARRTAPARPSSARTSLTSQASGQDAKREARVTLGPTIGSGAGLLVNVTF